MIMKIQIDTSAKTIKLEQSAKITEILSVVKKLLPNDWKEYSLEAVTIINNWQNPVIIPYWPYYPYQPINVFTTCGDGMTFTNDNTCAINSTVCNYEITTN